MTEQKREINAEKWIEKYCTSAEFETATKYKGGYWLVPEQMAMVLRTYGKELLLEAAERADVTADELGQPIVNTATITHIIDSL
jgi:hypothetical protein